MPKVGLLWRAEWDPPRPGSSVAESCRLHGVFAAFAALGVARRAGRLRRRPGRRGSRAAARPGRRARLGEPDRARPRPLAARPAAPRGRGRGRLGERAPDVILRMATKQVLFDTARAELGHRHAPLPLRRRAARGAPARLADGRPRVLKQQRGMGGAGRLEGRAATGDDAWLRVQHATRDAPPEQLPLSEFVARCEPYFDGGGLMVEQPFQPRLARGDDPRLPDATTRSSASRTSTRAGLRPESAGEPPPGKRFELRERERLPGPPRPDGVRMDAASCSSSSTSTRTPCR